MFKKVLQEELGRARATPLTTVNHAGSEIMLFRSDLLEAGVKHSIGRCLLAHYMENGKMDKCTRAVVVHGAGNTVTAVKLAVDELNLGIKVVAVVYAETSEYIRNNLEARGIEVVADAHRSEGRAGRLSTARYLCEREPWYVLIEQHEEPLIVEIQQKTFGHRIAEEIAQPTHFIAGVGTGGTVFGIGTALRVVNPEIKIIALEGVGSTLTLWHAYSRVKQESFQRQRAAIETALARYQAAGMMTSLACDPDRPRDEWFDVAIDFPKDTVGVVGIEGLGVGDPTELIGDHLAEANEVCIVTDVQATVGVQTLAFHGIHAVESAGANFFVARQIAEELSIRGETGRIVTVVTAASHRIL